MFIVCDNVLRWLSQAYHNHPPLSWLGTGSERCTGGVCVCVHYFKYRSRYLYIGWDTGSLSKNYTI